MKVLINGKVKEIPEGLNLDQLLRHFSLPSQRIAIEMNTSVVRRKDWEDVIVNDSDKIEIIHFVGGG
ncbi:MAG: sulfur carrier protein ThiS [Pyrinomonadaceae bacterium]|nr:sulfur carrier protein ThiS [Blastocatellia bacterium]MDQ3221191.1 sulfur carrier protein ThiS [Acidobacteriota bacterium]MDQ3491048.1 sulfur carrier protein ThiS [Acidobacteriota bacterium]